MNHSGRADGPGITEFSDFTIAHPNLVRPVDTILNVVREDGGYDLVLVYGPTGVGKTTIIRQAHRKILQLVEAMGQAEPGIIPIGATEAIPPENGKFSWKDYYIRALSALHEPLIDKKVDLDSFAATGRPPRPPGDTNALRRSLENALRYRKVRAFFIDEAHHLAMAAGSRKVSQQLEVIKSLANLSGTLHILVGTYDLLALEGRNGQLARRVKHIHVPRYRADVEGERVTFLRVLLSFQSRLPISECVNLTEHWEFMYSRTVGCVGILKNWLLRALNLALEEGQQSLTLDHLHRTALSISQCKRIAEEALEGERAVATTQDDEARLHQLLGLPIQSENSEPRSNGTRKISSRRVGERKPVRDSVGTNDRGERLAQQ